MVHMHNSTNVHCISFLCYPPYLFNSLILSSRLSNSLCCAIFRGPEMDLLMTFSSSSSSSSLEEMGRLKCKREHFYKEAFTDCTSSRLSSCCFKCSCYIDRLSDFMETNRTDSQMRSAMKAIVRELQKF